MTETVPLSEAVSAADAVAGSPAAPPSRELQCMEIIGGNQAVQTTLAAAGLDIWVDSRPHAGCAGGDIHYFSMCGSGAVTRLVLADIAGHGPRMDDLARSLRRLMRKHINVLDQTRFARAVNREFTHQVRGSSFATVLLATYFAPTNHLIVCNGGHPSPLWYRAATGRWQWLDAETSRATPSIREETARYHFGKIANLPLGVIEPIDYDQFAVKLEPGDLVVLYTDAFPEARRADGQQLEMAGLLDLVSRLDASKPGTLASALVDAAEQWRDGAPAEDDQTLIVLHHNGSGPPRMTVGRAMKSMARMLGLSRV